MIGLDTNILLRLVLQDDAEQCRRVDRLMESLPERGPGHINAITLMEFSWFLRKRLRVGRAELAAAIADLLEARDIEVEDEWQVEEALDLMNRTPAEFPDILIALRNTKSGCHATMTLDRTAAAAIPGMELLT
ncbi:PIN domain-containing protein [Martelella mediterranea]|uniref:Putative nucleic-acid-binding protein, contains PIN domain n=1 Tax=Martelella mediterranea DSM 17316 TaxID=1122214 RepID=A0A1U9Z5R5_9HYPH|nr:type II toxin-antitoxin system VapC family toxin [Martelella mediterranea]AQZ52960.1 putative nucleic-acid-binding protein, contains PIN domain [Martelella mediterranea DSM 17316]